MTGVTELANVEYLRDLAERLRSVPGPHVDGYDIDRLLEVAREIDPTPRPQGDISRMVSDLIRDLPAVIDFIAPADLHALHDAITQVVGQPETKATPHGYAEAAEHASTSDDPVVQMLRNTSERLDRLDPDVAGARFCLHGARLAVSSRLLDNR